ncbi:unnamed protein product, partial [Mesorhabditis belari]|uniref:RRM domain-containing protein n=1 Tax=Mesorhabditis belari TaxID=2138241 RepID=A0AAF3JAD9_9BILA
MSSDEVDSDSDVEMKKEEQEEEEQDDDSGTMDIEDLDEQIEAARKQLAADPYDISSHVKLCALLRKNGDLDELTEARNAWNDVSPLPAAEWIRWIKDQQSIDDTLEAMTAIFEKSFQDFQYADVWLEYVQWACGHGPDFAKKVFEQAVEAIGLRFDKGAFMWEAYLDFLTIVFEAASDENRDKEFKILCTLYKRALSVPNWNVSQLHERWIEFADKYDVDEATKKEVDQEHKKAVKKLGEFKAWEKKLEESEFSIDVFSQYLEFEKDKGDISRIKSFFERIVEKHPDCENLWYNYGQWVEETLKRAADIRWVYERAVRNCYYSCGLWQKTLLAIENANGATEEIDRLWLKAKECISSPDDGRALYTTYVYLLRRRSDCNQDYALAGEIYAEGQKVLQEAWGHNWDPQFTFRKNYAWFAFTRLKDYKLGHRVWEDILASGGGRFADKWLAAIRDERQFGNDLTTARKMFYRALNSVSDHPHQIFEAIIQFEREEGTLEQLQAALDKVNTQVLQRASRPQKKEREENKTQKHNSNRPNTDQRNNRSAGHSEKRKSSSDSSHEHSPSTKRLRAEPPIETKAVLSVSPVVKDNDGFVVPGLPIRTSPSPSPTPPVHSGAGPSSDGKKWVIFVSNLDFKCPESAIEEALNPGVVKIDLRYRGMSKLNMGYGSVEMDTREHYEAALKKDRVLINGRPLYVNEHHKKDDDEKLTSSSFKYSTSLERKKLFVKNVHFDATDARLKEVFSQFGKVVDARIVVQKSGKAKGIAYVDMETEEAASKAIQAKELVLLDRQLEVFLSNPPKKSSMCSDMTSLTRKGHSSMIQLVPRATRVGNAKDAKKPAPTNGASKPMNNDQFRQLFNKCPIRLSDLKSDRRLSRFVGLMTPPLPDAMIPTKTTPTAASTTEAIKKPGNDSVDKDESHLLAPFEYIRRMPGKQVRSRLAMAFNDWLHIPQDKLKIIMEVVEMLHNSSLLIDDIEDSSVLRRGLPVTHSIYGVPRTINSANYIYFVALQKCMTLGFDATAVFTEQLLELHRGQGKEIFWRDTICCPTIEQYEEMVLQKTGGLFFLAVRLMLLFTGNEHNAKDFTSLFTNMALFFQIRDDYMNLCSPAMHAAKTFAEDLTEGKFSYPIIQAIHFKKGLNDDDDEVINILRQRTNDPELKAYCIKILQERGALEATSARLCELVRWINADLKKLGGNEKIGQVMAQLEKEISQ